MTPKEQHALAKQVYDLLMASEELGSYTRPFVRSWRQEHFPKAEFEKLLATRTPAQIAKYMLHFCRTNRKSWSGQIVSMTSQSQAFLEQNLTDTNELETEYDTFIVAKKPNKEGKIVIIKCKEL